MTSVRLAAVGGTPWHDPSVAPHIGQHDSPGGLFGPGLGGVIAAGVMSGMGPGGFAGHGYGGPFGGGPGGYGNAGGYWAFRALGAAMNPYSGGQRPMTTRADVRYGQLTPETEDLAALTTSGARPTVLAFALLTPAGGGDPVAYEVLNLPEPATYVYRAGGRDPRALVNQALDDAGFATAEIHAAASGDLAAPHRQDAATSPLTGSLVATIKHDGTWAQQVAAQLT